MRNLKLIFLSIMILLCGNLFAQTKEYSDLLSKALNTLFADLPNNCKNLCGNESEKFKNSFDSKVKFPNSTNNQIDIFPYKDYPVIFYSHVEADNNNAKALIQQHDISKAILATIIKYKNKNYKIIYIEGESKNGDMPDYKYKLENGPLELEGVKLYVRKGTTFRNEAYKYHFEMGLYNSLLKEKEIVKNTDVKKESELKPRKANKIETIKPVSGFSETEEDAYALRKLGMSKLYASQIDDLLTQVSKEKLDIISKNCSEASMIDCINKFLQKNKTINASMLNMYVVATYRDVFEAQYCIVEVPIGENKIANCPFYKDFYFIVKKDRVEFVKQ
jgi:hypothetical protein